MREKALGLRTVELEYDGSGRLDRYRDTDAGFTWRDQLYDGRGNVTSDGVHGFSYDTSGQPYAITGGRVGPVSLQLWPRRHRRVQCRFMEPGPCLTLRETPAHYPANCHERGRLWISPFF
jgi:hypothetical protein